MSYKYLRLFYSLLIAFISLSGTYGQISDSLFRLEEVQVVSDRLGLSEARTGRHVTVIKASDIESLPVNTIDELLRYVPFMEVQSRGPYGAQSDILMRGSTFNQVLVLIDGMRVNDPLTGHFNSNIPIAVTNISRIEVYRGPASAVYGPDAVGGVVNIITKSFEPGATDEGLTGKLEAWYGQHNLRRSNSGLNFSKGRWKAGAGLSYNASDGHPLDPDSLRGDFNNLTASFSVSGQITDNINLSLRTAFDNRLFNARYFYTNSPFDMSREEVKKWWNQAQIRFRLNESHSLTLLAGYQTTRDSFLFNPAFPANIHRTHFSNYQINHHFLPGKGFRLASGVQLENRKIFSSDRGDHIHWHTGVYAVLSKEFSEQFTLGMGLRMDYDQVYGVELLPQFNLSYRRGKYNFRGSAGRSIRSPDFTERYISTGLEGPLSPGRNLGNPNLIAERAWSLEYGADRLLSHGIQARYTGFYRFGRDLIDYVMTPSEEIVDNENLIPGESYFYTQNVGLISTYGLEAEINGRHPFSGKWIFDWNLSWQILGNNSDSDIVSKYLASHSRNLLNGGVGLSKGEFRVRVSSMYKTRDPEIAEGINQELTDAYMLWNIRMDKYFWQNRIQLSLQVNNLLNEDYSDIMGAKMPGRWILGGVTWNFHR